MSQWIEVTAEQRRQMGIDYAVAQARRRAEAGIDEPYHGGLLLALGALLLLVGFFAGIGTAILSSGEF